MLQAFIITLREGVEAALIIGIVFAYLNKVGRSALKRTVFIALAAALASSVVAALIIARTQFNQDIFEGWVMLAAAVFVLSMVWFMNKTARHLKGEIESKVSKFTGLDKGPAEATWSLGLFFFVYLLVLREGVETVLILSAVSLNSTELLSFTGTLLGVAVAVIFGVMFVRGSLRINLQRFFRVTTVILWFVAFQLIVSGLHELSENHILPSSQSEMRYIGPIVRNDIFFFVTMLALTALMMLFEYKRKNADATIKATSPSDAHQAVDAAALRKQVFQAKRERLWLTAVTAASFLFIFLSTAEFIYARSTTALSPAQPVTLTGSQVAIPTSQITDDKLHRFAVNIDEGTKSTQVRFLLFKKPDGNIVSVADACTICGPVGFYTGPQGIICKMCASPLNPQSMGQPGGCNPIPLKSTNSGGLITIAADDLRQLAPRFAN